MSVTCMQEGRVLTAVIAGELDHHHAKQVMRQLDCQIDLALPGTLILDLGELTFTDSSGIAVLLRAHRAMGSLGGVLQIKNVPEQAKRVFFAAGLQKLMRFI